MYRSVCTDDHFVEVSAIAEQVLQPNSHKTQGPLCRAPPTPRGWKQLDSYLRRGGPAGIAASAEGRRGGGGGVRGGPCRRVPAPRHRPRLPARPAAHPPPRSSLRSPPAPAGLPHIRRPARLLARWLAHSHSGAAAASSPKPLLRPGRAAGGWVCWLCRESRRVSVRPAATDN